MIAFEPKENQEQVFRNNDVDEYHVEELLALEPEGFLLDENLVFAYIEEEKDVIWDMVGASTFTQAETDCTYTTVVDDCPMMFYYGEEFLVVYVKRTDIDYAENILNSFL